MTSEIIFATQFHLIWWIFRKFWTHTTHITVLVLIVLLEHWLWYRNLIFPTIVLSENIVFQRFISRLFMMLWNHMLYTFIKWYFYYKKKTPNLKVGESWRFPLYSDDCPSLFRKESIIYFMEYLKLNIIGS